MDIQLNARRVSIVHINTWRPVNPVACLEHASLRTNPDFRPAAKRSLTIAVVTDVKDAQVQFVSVTVKVAEVLERVKNQANGMNGTFPYSVSSFK
jgi:hypothetical protein